MAPNGCEAWLAKPKLSAAERRLVGPGRVERPTSRLSGVRSNHLSYEPDEVFVQQHPEGIGPSGHRRKEEEKRRRRHGLPIVLVPMSGIPRESWV